MNAGPGPGKGGAANLVPPPAPLAALQAHLAAIHGKIPGIIPGKTPGKIPDKIPGKVPAIIPGAPLVRESSIP